MPLSQAKLDQKSALISFAKFLVETEGKGEEV